MVEYDLERLLRPRFRRSDDATWLRLTSENGPANSFSQKINLAFAFGIIDEKRRKALIAIKNVRNVFAHSKKLIEFNDPLIVEELSEVKIADRKHARTFASMMKERRGLLASYRQAKGAFIYLCLILSNYLNKRYSQPLKAQTTKRRKALARALTQTNPLQGAFQQASLGGGGGLLSGLYGLGSKSPGGLPSYAELIAQLAQKKPDNEDK